MFAGFRGVLLDYEQVWTSGRYLLLFTRDLLLHDLMFFSATGTFCYMTHMFFSAPATFGYKAHMFFSAPGTFCYKALVFFCVTRELLLHDPLVFFGAPGTICYKTRR